MVRIRRSHRRGPGSIPGQGSLSSFARAVSQRCRRLHTSPFHQQTRPLLRRPPRAARPLSRLPFRPSCLLASPATFRPSASPLSLARRRSPRSHSSSAPNSTGHDSLSPPVAAGRHTNNTTRARGHTHARTHSTRTHIPARFRPPNGLGLSSSAVSSKPSLAAHAPLPLSLLGRLRPPLRPLTRARGL